MAGCVTGWVCTPTAASWAGGGTATAAPLPTAGSTIRSITRTTRCTPSVWRAASVASAISVAVSRPIR